MFLPINQNVFHQTRTPVAARARTYFLKHPSGTSTRDPPALSHPVHHRTYRYFLTSASDSVASCTERPRPCCRTCNPHFWHSVFCVARGLEFDDLCDANLDILLAFVRGASEGEIQGRFKG